MKLVALGLTILGLGCLILWYRRWSLRRAVEILVGHPTAMLFELARADGPVNEMERKYIGAYALTAFELMLRNSDQSINPFWLEGIVRNAEAPLREYAKTDYLRFLSRTPKGARNFFDICLALAQVDGKMKWSERVWLEMQGTFSMLDVSWFMGVLENACPCSLGRAVRK